jgi:hypothetical protein
MLRDHFWSTTLQQCEPRPLLGNTSYKIIATIVTLNTTVAFHITVNLLSIKNVKNANVITICLSVCPSVSPTAITFEPTGKFS